jgi:hypothetical protein
MAIKKDRFIEGEYIGTVREEIKERAFNFLSKNPDKAYTLAEIMADAGSSVGKYAAVGAGVAAVFLVPALDELIETRRIVSRKIGRQIYFSAAQ